MTAAISVAGPPQNPIAAVFNLDDPAERFIVQVIQRFHGEDRLYRAHRLRRTINDKGQRVVVELARFVGHKPCWEVIYWNPDEISVRFAPCQDRQSAEAVYNTEPLLSLACLRGAKMPKPKDEQLESNATRPKPEDLSMDGKEFEGIMRNAFEVKPAHKKDSAGPQAKPSKR